jgi:NADH:ubiquinone oxidoreductase subunit C
MDDSVNGAPDEVLEPLRRIDYEREPAPNSEPRRAQSSREQDRVERQLTQYGFTREERDHEVRLLLRDVAADEVAMSFRAAGATFITLTGERAAGEPGDDRNDGSIASEVEEEDAHPQRRHRRTHAPQTGELTLRYFYALGDTVYTVSIATTSEVVASIASVFPAAMLLEREAQERLAVVFRSARL